MGSAPDPIVPTADGIVIAVRVIPRASRSGVAGTRDGALLVRLHAPPVEGAANAELIELLARLFEVPRRNVSILSGATSKHKRVKVVGINVERAASRLSD
jgi:uncharacterized protein (TIGR00251 family)